MPDVTFEAIRKSDFAPYASMWLGGKVTDDTIQGIIDVTNKPYQEVDSGWIVDLGDWKKAIDFIVEIEDSFYIGNYGDEAISFINRYQDQMAYFLRVS